MAEGVLDGQQRDLPLVVIGAGPVGLAAAAHLVERGLTPLVLEAGDGVGANVARWGHVRLFSPWCVDLDAAAVRLLRASGWAAPPSDDLPTGAELVERYLRPLAELPAIAPHLRFGRRVVALAREGVDKVRSPGREGRPFLVRVATADGHQVDLRARAVLDASGTWTQPNPLGAAGLPARGEAAARDRILTGLPDVLGADHDRFAGRRVAVVGAGHSAATTLLALAGLQATAPRTRIAWVVRAARPRPLVGKGEADELPARGQLGLDLRRLVEAGRIELVTGFRTVAIERAGDQVVLIGQSHEHAGHAPPRVAADLVVNATGFRPDHAIAAELRLALDPGLDSVAGLAELIDPNVHTCGSVPPHGARELAQPDAGYWMLGMKSYGRAPTFLLATGYEQVRSVVADLVGDRPAATEVRLTLPPGGGCPAHLPGDTSAACCGGTVVAPEPRVTHAGHRARS